MTPVTFPKDYPFAVGNVGTRGTEKTGQPMVLSSGSGRLFYSLDVIRCTVPAFKRVFGDKNQVLIMDPSWATPKAEGGCYTMHGDKTMFSLFRDKIAGMFDLKSHPNKEGFLFLWFTTDKLDVARECMRLAGYNCITIGSWIKLNQDGSVLSMASRNVGNVELFLVGRKSNLRSPTYVCKSSGLAASKFENGHSSKPEEFYTRFVPTFVDMYSASTFAKMPNRVDLFSRQIQPGFTSVGLEFDKVRQSPENTTCQGCNEIVACLAADVLYCEASSACGRAWHKSCLCAKVAARFVREKECPGCASGDLVPVPLSALFPNCQFHPFVVSDSIKKQLPKDSVAKISAVVEASKKRDRPQDVLVGRKVLIACKGRKKPFPARIKQVDAKKGIQVEWQNDDGSFGDSEFIHDVECVLACAAADD